MEAGGGQGGQVGQALELRVREVYLISRPENALISQSLSLRRWTVKRRVPAPSVNTDDAYALREQPTGSLGAHARTTQPVVRLADKGVASSLNQHDVKGLQRVPATPECHLHLLGAHGVAVSLMPKVQHDAARKKPL